MIIVIKNRAAIKKLRKRKIIKKFVNLVLKNKFHFQNLTKTENIIISL